MEKGVLCLGAWPWLIVGLPHDILAYVFLVSSKQIVHILFHSIFTNQTHYCTNYQGYDMVRTWVFEYANHPQSP